MNWKTTGMLVLMFVSFLALSSFASAAVEITKVKVDGTDVTNNDNIRLVVERGEEIDVEVTVKALSASLDDVQIEAFIRGYDHDDLIEDITDVFDADTNRTYKKELTLKIPERIDIKDSDEYTMVILVESRDGVLDILKWNVNLAIDSPRHQLRIKDVVLSPETEIQAGRALLATVRVQNIGETDEEGIKVRASIRELGVSASDYIDELKAEKSTTSEELYLRVPAAAKPGVYDVRVEVIYDDGDSVETETAQIAVVEGEASAALPTATSKTVIAVGVESQDVAQGASAMYPVTITNAGTSARSYTLTADGADWAAFSVSPTNTALLQPGESASMFVSVSAKQGAVPGERMFALTVTSGGDTLKQIPLKANIKAVSTTTGMKKGLEIGLVVLVVLLVILGLIIGFSKLRGGEEEEKSTYY